MVATNTGFNPELDLIKENDRLAGLFLLSPMKTRKDKILQLTTFASVVIIITFATSTMILTNFSLLSIILSGGVVSVLINTIYAVLSIFWNKPEITKMLDWCQKLYEVDQYRHPKLLTAAIFRTDKTCKVTLKLLKWTRIIICSEAFMITIGFAIIGQFLPDNIYPKYSPPLPYYLPFKNQNTYFACFVTTLLQFIFAYSMGIVTVAYLGLFYTIILHFITSFKIILDAINIMGDEMNAGCFKNDGRSKDLNKPRKPLAPLATQGTSKETIDKNLSFEDWIQIIVYMINDVNGNIQRFGDMFKVYFMFLEVGSYGSIFFFGMTFFVMEQHYYHTFLVIMVDVILLSFCYTNEKINDHFFEISRAFYSTCWYNLELKEQKLLLLAMNCTAIQDGFTASNVHSLTLERFRLIVNAAYSNCLVLKNLINKN